MSVEFKPNSVRRCKNFCHLTVHLPTGTLDTEPSRRGVKRPLPVRNQSYFPPGQAWTSVCPALHSKYIAIAYRNRNRNSSSLCLCPFLPSATTSFTHTLEDGSFHHCLHLNSSSSVIHGKIEESYPPPVSAKATAPGHLRDRGKESGDEACHHGVRVPIIGSGTLELRSPRYRMGFPLARWWENW